MLVTPATVSVQELTAYPFPGEWDRTQGIFDGDQLVATHFSYPFAGFPVPGGAVSAAGLSGVGVVPQYRRRGLLRRMIRHHFAASLDRGEAISVLYASEPEIYGRFGYGVASQALWLAIPRAAELHPVPECGLSVQIERLGPAHAEELCQAHTRIDRPGWAHRTTAALRTALALETPHLRGASEPPLVAIVRHNRQAVGWARFSRHLEWPNGNPRGTTAIKEVVAQSAPVASALWTRLLDLDLMSTITVGRLALDDPLLNLLVNQRTCVPHLSDNLWLRILDLPTALTSRTYRCDADLVLEIEDALLPANAGRWRLQVTGGRATIEPTTRAADLTMGVDTLARAFLGGITMRALADAGQVEASSEQVLREASLAFTSERAPVCSWAF